MDTLNLVLTIIITVLTSGALGLKLSKAAINKAVEESKEAVQSYMDAKKPESDGGVKITVNEYVEIGKNSIEALDAIQKTGILKLIKKLFSKKKK